MHTNVTKCQESVNLGKGYAQVDEFFFFCFPKGLKFFKENSRVQNSRVAIYIRETVMGYSAVHSTSDTYCYYYNNK